VVRTSSKTGKVYPQKEGLFFEFELNSHAGIEATGMRAGHHQATFAGIAVPVPGADAYAKRIARVTSRRKESLTL
jgi:hypothetical protein